MSGALEPALAARLVVECRGQLCQVAPRHPDDATTAIRWSCRGQFCQPVPDGAAWFVRLAARTDRRFWTVRQGPVRTAGAERAPYYQLVAEKDRDRPEAMAVLRRFADPLQHPGLFQDCERRFPARGRLVVQLRLTYPEDPGPPRIEHDFSGDLGGSPLARCIAGVLQAAAARFELPAYAGGAVIKAKLDFPGARPAP
jgi:hypothetical protein